ncbi:anthranilate phosphoribosyltransferase [Acetobacter vaccinii]|uniref:Anthranilate phosphoribosyltransferase n=1 Tax=Acetobacter vaccinii TaxID=2592655 RepID=A0A5C1YRM1_9PROT|nr:anthranilate phosphoribosyltransferase [Acetobacter vaccinii]QEO18305.1 anthranilate phosphoribosyltransferase [Acetobacter vaccinii]
MTAQPQHSAPDAYDPTRLTATLLKLADRHDLDVGEAEAAFGAIMDGAVPPEHIAAFLMALRVKGETRDELLGAVTALRARMHPVPAMPEDTLDVCGTGGDHYGTLNVSTAVAFVLAGLGVPVAKHGNRAVSSRSGASDVLTALGVPLSPGAETHAAWMRDYRAIFLAAPHHHPAMRHAAAVRKMLALPTLFNLVGPLVNPAGVKRQLIGVFSPRWLEPIVDVLRTLGSERVWAVCGQPRDGKTGIDEITLAGPTLAVALEQGQTCQFVIEPEMAGLAYAPVSAIKGKDAHHNAATLDALLHGAAGPYRDTVLLNAACALHIAGRVSILRNGHIDPTALQESVAQAAFSLDSGAALAVLNGLRSSSAMHTPET